MDSDIRVFEIPKYMQASGLHANCSGCQHILPKRKCVYRMDPINGISWPCFFRESFSKEDAQKTIDETRIVTAGVYRGPKL